MNKNPYVPHYKQMGIEPLHFPSKSPSETEVEGATEQILNKFKLPTAEELQSVIDDDINFDSVVIDSNNIIDNNEYVNIEPNNIFRNVAAQKGSAKLENKSEYIVIANDILVGTFTEKFLQLNCLHLILGTHPDFPNEKFDIEKILIYKKVNIKLSIELEE